MPRRRAASLSEARGALRRKIQTEGAEAAYAALVAVCNDSKAPAPAKATAGTSLLRAAGYFEKVDDPEDKELYELTPPELERIMQNLVRMRDQIEAAERGDVDDDGEEDGVFG